MRKISTWIYSAAGKVSIILITFIILLFFLIFSTYGEKFITIETANTLNNILIGIATGLIGIVITVSFVQYVFDKQDEYRKRSDEIRSIKRYDKYMNTLIRKFFMSYISVTTRLNERTTVDLDNPFNHSFKFSDIADMYLPSMYLNEGFLEPSIVSFYRAEENVREYMLRMLENIDFKYNLALENILLDFVTKSADWDVRGNIISAIDTKIKKNQKLSEYISKLISDEKTDWLEKFQRNELQGNIMFPYVMFYYNIQNQARILKDYTDYIKTLNCE